MKNKKEIVSENLVALRKSFGFTQIELSKKINYSDKAISRWENGEVEPDFDTLESLSKIYHVNFEYFFHEHDESQNKIKHNKRISRFTIMLILLDLFVWTLLTVIFVYRGLQSQGSYDWQLFLLGSSITFLLLVLANKFFIKSKPLYFISTSLLLWSTLSYAYCLNLPENQWLIYLIGIPIQAIFIVAYYLTHEQ